ncbi:hypothetical protein Csa_016936 [Cucumis sativus]|uniref:PHD finger protein ALFIN-LIKE n=1 Tax=Cucumis sativus TaxID=3659 RepID=A0A0A0KPZ8_CUCSA|nr:hypothetical protein Csa_016936 [Cucumis sativus]
MVWITSIANQFSPEFSFSASVHADVCEFYGLCDSGEEIFCLYGHPNETWEMVLPVGRDGMDRKYWRPLVAVHGDSCLLSVAFYFGARLDRSKRYNCSTFEFLLVSFKLGSVKCNSF